MPENTVLKHSKGLGLMIVSFLERNRQKQGFSA
jgi:hypothetical protein